MEKFIICEKGKYFFQAFLEKRIRMLKFKRKHRMIIESNTKWFINVFNPGETKINRHLCSLILIWIAFTSGSCVNTNHLVAIRTMNTNLSATYKERGYDEYLLQVGDVIHVKLFYNPELNEKVKIRPDGRISLQLIDEVKVSGLTPAELDRILTDKYSKILKTAEVSVIVSEFNIQTIYIGGEVERPSEIPWRPGLTTLRAIFKAGGFKTTACAKSVIIVSKGPNDMPVAKNVNLHEIISSQNPQNDISLKPFDIVFVPKTYVAKANKFVEQYLTRMIPAWLSGDFSYTVVKSLD